MRSKFSSNVLRLALMITFVVFALAVMVFAVVVGQPAIVDSLLNESDGVTDGEIVAEASQDNTYGSSDGSFVDSAVKATNDYMGNGYTYSITGNPSGAHRRYYWSGNGSTNKYDSGNGWMNLYASGTVRQKEIVFTGHIKIKLTGVLSNLALKGKLSVKATATMSSTTGYDEDMKWGLYNGNKTSVSNSYGSPGLNVVSSVFSTTSSGKNNTQTLSAMTVSGTDTITIVFIARTNYGSGIGGRYPGGKISGISLAFTSTDSSAPVVSLGDVGGWAKTKNIKVTATDAESGNSMYSYPTSATYDSNYTYTFSNVTSALSNLVWTNRSGVSNSPAASYSLDQMKIDRVAPVISDIKLRTGNSMSSAEASSTSSSYQDIWITFTVKDAASGVNTSSISVVNTYDGNSAVTKVSVTQDSSDKTKYNCVFGPISKNGYFKIYATDAVGWEQNGYIACRKLDKSAPEVSYTIDTVGGYGAAQTSPVYADSAVKVTFTVLEAGEQSFIDAYKNGIAIGGVKPQYVYNYADYTNTHGITSFKLYFSDSSRTPQASDFILSATESNWVNGVLVQKYVAYLPDTGRYSVTVTDKSGRVADSPVIFTYIDTTSPRVTDFSVDNNATTAWTDADVTLRLDVTDLYSGNRAVYNNQGSGLKMVQLYGVKSSSDGIDKGTLLDTYNVPAGDARKDSVPVTFILRNSYNIYSKYYWKVTDNAGNTSEESSATLTWNGTTFTNYNYNAEKGANGVSPIKQDRNGISITVKDGADDKVFSNKASDNVVLAWTKEANTTFTIHTTFGPSGAKISTDTSNSTVMIQYAYSVGVPFDETAVQWLSIESLVVANGSGDPNGVLNKFGDALKNPSNNNAVNEKTITFTVGASGVTYYRFRFTNGAGKVVTSGTIVVRRDNRPVEATILGFGDFGYDPTLSTDSGVINATQGFISESTLRLSEKWLGGTSVKAVIRIKDSDSGADQASQTYNVDNANTAIQESLAKATLIFSHNGYTYTKELGFYQTCNGLWVINVTLCDLAEITQKACRYENGNQIMMFRNGTFDILKGQNKPFVYKIEVSDFIGNKCYVQDGAGNTDLSYKVDPFDLAVSVDAITQYDVNVSATAYNGDWTKYIVNIHVNKTQMGLTPVAVKYYENNGVSETSDGKLTGLETRSINPTTGTVEWLSVGGDTATATEATIELTKASRFAQIIVTATNDTTYFVDANGNRVGSAKFAPLQFNVPDGGDDDYIIVKQDVDAPNMDTRVDGSEMGFFFSTSPDITNVYIAGRLNSDILLFYRTEKTKDGYVATRMTEQTQNIVWSAEYVYLYIIATDSTGAAGHGMGSGIKSVKYDLMGYSGETMVTPKAYNSYTYQGLYCTTLPLGYENTTDNGELKLVLIDNLDTRADITFAGVNNEKIVPVIDTVIPQIYMQSTTPSDFEDRHGNGEMVSYFNEAGKLSGMEINVDLTVNFKVTLGKSNAKLYVRTRPYQEGIDPNDNAYNPKYNGQIGNGNYLLAEIDLSEWTELKGSTHTAPTTGSGVSISIDWLFRISKSEPIKYRYDVLVVSGTGTYTFLEMGDVYIDAIPPVITESFWALQTSDGHESEGTATDVIDYDLLKIATADTKTNDNLYAYFKITDDKGSGVDDANVKLLMPTSVKDTVLEKVWIAKNGEQTEYYRMLVTSGDTYKFRAYDNAGNYSDSIEYQPKIDKTQVRLDIEMKAYKSNGEESYRFFEDVYTNALYVMVTLSVTYGANSGFGKVLYAVSDNGQFGEYKDLSDLLVSIGIISGQGSGESDEAFKARKTIAYNNLWTIGNTQARIEFRITDEQKRYYTFKAFNGIEEKYIVDKEVVFDDEGNKSFADKKVKPYELRGADLDNDPIRIAIDKTAPRFSYEESVILVDGQESKASFIENSDKKSVTLANGTVLKEVTVYSTNQWFGTGIALGLSIVDPNKNICSQLADGGITLNYSIKGVAQDQYTFADDSAGKYFAMNGDEKFLYENYVSYVVTMTDNAGNSTTIIIEPKMDLYSPIVEKTALQTVEIDGESVTVVGNYTTSDGEDNWTFNDVRLSFNTIFGISGATLQYYTDKTNKWQDVKTYTYNEVSVSTDDGKTLTEAGIYNFIAEANSSLDASYKFRLVSGGGIVGAELNVGRVKIDKEVPEIAVAVTVLGQSLADNLMEDLTKKEAYRTVMSKWTQDNVTVSVKTSSALVSGFTIAYSIVQQAEPDWQYLSGTQGNGTSTYQLSGKEFIHRITSSKNNENYCYKFISGSGLESEVFHVDGVKVDKTAIGLTIDMEVSDLKGIRDENDATKFGTTTADNYQRNKLLSSYDGDPLTEEEIEYLRSDEVVYTSGVYTNKNSVIVKVMITRISFSGVSLYINNVLYDTFSYEDYKDANISSDNPIDRYYVISNDYRQYVLDKTDGDLTGGYYNDKESRFDLQIKLISGSGITKSEKKNIGIDNDIPFVYVAGISGKKSTNWDPTDPNSCWYIGSDTKIDLKVGTLVTVGGEYEFSDRVSGSGYEIFCSVNGGEWVSRGTTAAIDFTGNPIVENAVYRFKIVSKSGMEYVLGEDALDNMGEFALSASELKEVISSMGGVVDHLTDVDFEYRINADSAAYEIGDSNKSAINQLFEFYVGETAVVEESLDYSFASYTITKTVNLYDAEGNVIGTEDKVMGANDYIYRHGDRITISYVSATANDYYHRYTEYGRTENGVFVESEIFTGAEYEVTGSFGYQFSTNNLAVKSYFIKELDVSYADTVVYKQVSDGANVKPTATYSYKRTTSGAPETIFVPLSVSYSDMEGKEIDGTSIEVGGYVVNVTVDGKNADSFRLKNPQTVLLVKYFEETKVNFDEIPNSAENPYRLYNERDLSYISSSFYKDYYLNEEGKFVLGTVYNYSDCAFSLENDVVMEELSTIGDFAGTFEANNNTVTLKGGVAKDGFGLFGTVSGTVRNLALVVDGTIVVDGAKNVGTVAETVDGGELQNVRVDARIEIAGTVADTNVGGLIGKMSGTTSVVNGAFADVTIENHGKELNGGNVGGLVGYHDAGVIASTYTYSHIVLYNVNNVKVGAVVGNATNSEFVGTSQLAGNMYIAHNTFVEDEAVNSFIGTTSGAEDRAGTITAVAHDSFVGNTSDMAGSKYIAGKLINVAVIEKVYKTFGLELSANGKAESGLGTTASPLEISTVDQLRAIDEYVNLSYALYEDVDMTAFGTAIGLHQVYGGNFDGQGHKVIGFVGTDVADGSEIGMFAALNGTVGSLIFDDVQMILETTDTAYVGIVAGKVLGGCINDIIAIGNIEIVSDNTVYVGAVAGISEDGAVYDIFSIVNVKVNADRSAVVGGIIGRAQGTVLGGEQKIEGSGKVVTKSVYALGRVEANAAGLEVDAISAVRSLAEGSKNVFAVMDNVYANGNVISGNTAKVNMVRFDDGVMRATTFSDGTNVFNKVFVTEKLYYLSGLGTSTDKFIVRNATEFRKIEHMLYAYYNVANDIEFDDADENTAFKTIGYGLKFTGSIDGKNANSTSAEEGTLSSLMNVTDALVYENAGRITDLTVNVFYNKTLEAGELVFGAIAVKNSTGTLRNVTVSGEINIVGADKYDTVVVVSGFVGEGFGGTFETDSKVQNSISGLSITVTNVGTVYAGGYVGRVDGLMTLSYGIGSGTLDVSDCVTVYAGTLVGALYKANNWSSLDETAEYRYIVTVDGEEVTELFGVSV